MLRIRPGYWLTNQSAEEPHVAGQANEIHAVFRDLLVQEPVVSLAIQPAGRNDGSVEPERPCTLNPRRRRAVRKHYCDLRIQDSRCDIRGNRFEIRAAAGQQNREPLHTYVTRGAFRRAGTTFPIS